MSDPLVPSTGTVSTLLAQLAALSDPDLAYVKAHFPAPRQGDTATSTTSTSIPPAQTLGDQVAGVATQAAAAANAVKAVDPNTDHQQILTKVATGLGAVASDEARQVWDSFKNIGAMFDQHQTGAAVGLILSDLLTGAKIAATVAPLL